MPAPAHSWHHLLEASLERNLSPLWQEPWLLINKGAEATLEPREGEDTGRGQVQKCTADRGSW